MKTKQINLRSKQFQTNITNEKQKKLARPTIENTVTMAKNQGKLC